MSASSNCLQLLEQLAEVPYIFVRFIKEFVEFKVNTSILNLLNYITEEKVPQDEWIKLKNSKLGISTQKQLRAQYLTS